MRGNALGDNIKNKKTKMPKNRKNQKNEKMKKSKKREKNFKKNFSFLYIDFIMKLTKGKRRVC